MDEQKPRDWLRWGAIHIRSNELIGVFRSQAEAIKSAPLMSRAEYLITLVKIVESVNERKVQIPRTGPNL